MKKYEFRSFTPIRFKMKYVLVLMICLMSLGLKAQLVNPNADGGFENGASFAANGWTAVNGGDNKWYVGTATKCSGANAMYVDANTTAGTANTYTATTITVSHAYKDIQFPSCSTQISLSFFFKVAGQKANGPQGALQDYLAVYLVPTSTTPVAGTALAAANLIGTYQGSSTSTCTQANLTLPANIAGTTQRLVFTWINDAAGATNPAAMVDNISVTAAPGVLAFDEPCGALPVTVGNVCNFVQYNNTGCTPSAGFAVPSCGLYGGGDVWFTTTIPASGQLFIDGNAGSILDGDMAVYIGGPNPNSMVEVACDDLSSANGLMPFIGITTLLPGTPIWVRFWRYGGGSYGTFSLCFYTTACPGGTPPNDNCINAIPIPLGASLTGSTGCAGAVGEPAAANCWSTGSLNTVWYSVVCPLNGLLSIRTGLGTLTDTQIGVYSGNCGNLALVACNDDAVFCSNTQLWSQLVLTGLVPGAIYYVRIDGFSNSTGDFTITAIDGAQSWPTVFGQDCSTTFSVCSPNIVVGNPGFMGSGNTCDFSPGTGCPNSCLQVGERNSVWYSFTTSAAGPVSFTITPNGSVDFDFAMWNVTGLANPCSSISAGTNPIRCSYEAGLGPTGVGNGANDVCEGAAGDGFVSVINAAAGQTFILLISNYAQGTFVGYNLNFGATPINFTSGSNLAWTGGTDTDWIKTGNWGGCATPDCAKDVVIYGGPSNQPYIPSGATVNCRNLTIQPGASLTLAPNAILQVCGNFTNSGVLNAAPTSVLRFANAAANQSINGTVVAPNSIGTVEVTKTGGIMALNTNTEITGNFLVTNATSVVNANSFLHKLGGDFQNNGTYNAGTSTLQFNGTSGQTFFNAYGGSQLLNNVSMLHAGSGVTLLSNMRLGTGGNLTLTSGKVITTTSYEVSVANRAPASVTPGTTTSFVEGFLRRFINATGSYDFPVGEATKGYQRANINFAYAGAPTAIDQLRVHFTPYTPISGALGVIDCAINFNSNALDNGFWNFVPVGSATSGNFDLTLYNTNFTNATTGWSVQTDASGTGASWLLGNGTCAASTANVVKRTNMNGIYRFGTAQGLNVLPVSWLDFRASTMNDRIRLDWTTASESNADGYEVQRSESTGNEFAPIGWVDAVGNTTQLSSYLFNDLNVSPGKLYYYRLRQLDIDGQEDYSKIIAARMDNTTSVDVSIHPNPANPAATIRMMLPASFSHAVLMVDNAMGANLCALQLDERNVGLPVSFESFCKTLTPGVYTVRLVVDGEQVTRRIVWTSAADQR
jgi:hypothetical protein